MPGGSVNGRPFKESRDSFQKTGVPCGNPKRYHSQDVVRMLGQSSVRTKDLSGPVEDIETEGQRQLKTLLDKQLNTQATVQQQLSQSRQFSRSTPYKPHTDNVSGIIDLSEYRALEQQDGRMNELRFCGLTDEEIRLKLQVDDGYVESKKQRLEHEPICLQDKLVVINRKIEQHKKSLTIPDTFTGQTSVGRHAMDLEKSLVKDNINSKRLSTMLITNKLSSDFPHPDHPMNHIPEILEDIAGKDKFEKQRRRKRRKHEIAHDNLDTFDLGSDSGGSGNIIGCKTQEETIHQDSTHFPHAILNSNEIEPELKTPCNVSNSNCSSMYDGRIRDNLDNKCKEDKCDSQFENNKTTNCKMRDGLVPQIPECDIIANRLSLEEIRKLPKFEKYEEGIPNNVLYLKNLPHKVTENELGSLFLRYQISETSPITFRIMSGKMRGQAFITFNDKEMAEMALQLINGYKLHDKPIIIQYGKK